MDREIRKRLTWVGMCKETDNGGLVCRRCGISRPTLRQWWRWYQTEGTEGLRSRSRRPKTSRTRKVFEKDVNRILTLRSKRKLGARRIQSELLRQYEFRLNLATIHKVLVKNQVKPLVRLRREEHHKRYSRPISGDRVQMDTCKIAKGLYQYTTVDDCTRLQGSGLVPEENCRKHPQISRSGHWRNAFPGPSYTDRLRLWVFLLTRFRKDLWIGGSNSGWLSLLRHTSTVRSRGPQRPIWTYFTQRWVWMRRTWKNN